MAMQDVVLPDIGEGVTEGELVKWLVKAGDPVEADQPVAEIMTDKATVEVPSPVAGVVKELKREEGDVIPIETVLLTLDGAAGVTGTAPATPTPSEAQKPSTNGSVAPGFVSSPAVNTLNQGSADIFPPPAGDQVLATPASRRLAREMSVDINKISGTGLAGRVTRDDILNHGGTSAAPSSGAVSRPSKDIPKAAFVSSPGAAEERVAMRGIRKKIAANMQMAKHIIPHFTLMDEARVDALVEIRSQAKEVAEQYGVKVTYLPFIMKALLATIREFPSFNASIDDEAQETVYKNYYNLGFAADTPNGLLVPVIKNANQKNILELSKEIKELAVRARDGKLALDEMRGATITITNIGSVGGMYATPIINHPEVAIFGMYKIQDRPVWENGQWVPAKFMNFTVTCDHRLIDGAVAANFMSAFIKRIENPSRLMLEMI